MHELTVTAVGEDQPGIVAEVTGVFFRLGCNLADCTMTRLSRQFAMILLVQAPDSVTKAQLEEALLAASARFRLSISVVEAGSMEPPPHPRPHVISVYGADRPGIVHTIAAKLAQTGVNITDLVSHAGGDLYTIVMEVELPSGLDEVSLSKALGAIAGDLGVDVSVRPVEAPEL